MKLGVSPSGNGFSITHSRIDNQDVDLEVCVPISNGDSIKERGDIKMFLEVMFVFVSVAILDKFA